MTRLSTITAARYVFAAGLIGLGLLSLGSGDFALNWQPVANWLPLREIAARMSGLLMLAGGIGILIRKVAAPSSFAMAVYWLLCALFMHFSRVVQNPLDIGLWLGCAENLLVVSGAWLLFQFFAGFPAGPSLSIRLLVGLSCIICGLSHFRYAAFTANMVPAWIPGHMFFALLTGIGHIAAGLAIMSGVLPRLAATLEAAMISCFVLLLHLPAAIQLPGARMQWTMVFIASSMAASLWALAASYALAPWLPRWLRVTRYSVQLPG